MTCRCKYQFCYKCGGKYGDCECVRSKKYKKQFLKHSLEMKEQMAARQEARQAARQKSAANKRRKR